jgi:methylmalonyl-CoA/ethylmalonyl-CoA epimerase
MLPIDINKPIQVAIVVRDLDAKVRVWSELLGVEPSKVVTTGPLEETNTRYMGSETPARVRVAVFDLGHCAIELLEPIGGPSVWSDHLERQGEGLHHLGFLVDDMDASVESVASLGMTVVQEAVYENSYERGRYVYFDSQAELAALLEFNELT